MRSQIRCANCGRTEWTDSGNVIFVPREGADFGGRWIHGTHCENEVPVDELLQSQKEADWKGALKEYRQVREEIGRLEETGECSCEEFYTCGLCIETTSLDQRARSLMNSWGDTWAMKLIFEAAPPSSLSAAKEEK